MTIALIYARSENHCIGRAGGLPWHLPDEYRFFNEQTSGHAIIMGRRTFEDHNCALPSRLNIVVSRTTSRFGEDIYPVMSLAAGFSLAAKHKQSTYVIGGAGLLAEALPHASLVYESVIDATIDGDVFVEPFDFSDWEQELLAEHEPDERHEFGYRTRQYTRRD